MTETTGFTTKMDSVLRGSALYVLSAKDNGTLTACASGSCSTSASGIFGTSISANDQIILDSDGTNMIGIADNEFDLLNFHVAKVGMIKNQ